MRALTRGSLLAAAVLLTACGSASPEPGPTAPTLPLGAGQVLRTDATVRFLDLEGGCWMIVTDDGRRYEPISLAAQFKTSGQRVHVVLRDAPDQYSVCMLGPIVTVDSISAR